jgi:hypothetical protein
MILPGIQPVFTQHFRSDTVATVLVVKLTPCPIEFESGLNQVDEVRVIPRSGCYVYELTIFYKSRERLLNQDPLSQLSRNLVR